MALTPVPPCGMAAGRHSDHRGGIGAGAAGRGAGQSTSTRRPSCVRCCASMWDVAAGRDRPAG
ncbi:MAG: hypothetical protein MZW92_05520 [Comamonadaceae bacterium]|nr:hypothetical protein [Comamonadaceae bacterium]